MTGKDVTIYFVGEFIARDETLRSQMDEAPSVMTRRFKPPWTVERIRRRGRFDHKLAKGEVLEGTHYRVGAVSTEFFWNAGSAPHVRLAVAGPPRLLPLNVPA